MQKKQIFIQKTLQFLLTGDNSKYGKHRFKSVSPIDYGKGSFLSLINNEFRVYVLIKAGFSIVF